MSDACETSASQAFIDQLHNVLPGDLVEHYSTHRGEVTVHIKPTALIHILTTLRDNPNLRFHQLMDICGVDYPQRTPRFDVVYHLLSVAYNLRVRVKIQADDQTPVPSVTTLFKSANWWEREAWDMFGIRFAEHPDLRRLLTDYGFEGHPLRKDFPLSGHVEVRYDQEQKAVVYDPLTLETEFREFDFLSSWSGNTPPVLPGDEKAFSGPTLSSSQTRPERNLAEEDSNA